MTEAVPGARIQQRGAVGGPQSRPAHRVPGQTAARGRATHGKGYSTRASRAASRQGSATGAGEAQASPSCPIAQGTLIALTRAPPGGHHVRHRGHSLLAVQPPQGSGLTSPQGKRPEGPVHHPNGSLQT